MLPPQKKLLSRQRALAKVASRTGEANVFDRIRAAAGQRGHVLDVVVEMQNHRAVQATTTLSGVQANDVTFGVRTARPGFQRAPLSVGGIHPLSAAPLRAQTLGASALWITPVQRPFELSRALRVARPPPPHPQCSRRSNCFLSPHGRCRVTRTKRSWAMPYRTVS